MIINDKPTSLLYLDRAEPIITSMEQAPTLEAYRQSGRGRFGSEPCKSPLNTKKKEHKKETIKKNKKPREKQDERTDAPLPHITKPVVSQFDPG